MKTLKIHPHTQRFEIADPRVLALVTKAGELGVAVLMDNAGIVAGDAEDLFNLAAKAPKTRFIFAHMGGANFRFWNILVLARTADGFALDNVNFHISGTIMLAAHSPIEKEFVWTLRNVGIDPVMLGSDYPQISLARMVEALEKLDLTARNKRHAVATCGLEHSSCEPSCDADRPYVPAGTSNRSSRSTGRELPGSTVC